MQNCRITSKNLKVGQRVKARFASWPEAKVGVVSGPPTVTPASANPTMGELVCYPVQFAPCDCHWGCYEVSAYGDAGGWTDEEYRIERERAYCWERAERVEAERRDRYPDASFSAFRGTEVSA